jgi:hypothetical protein
MKKGGIIMQQTIFTLKATAKLFAVCLIFSICLARTAQIQAQDCDNYRFSMTTNIFTFGPVGTMLFTAGTENALSAVQPIGFNFNYCGVIYSQFIASSNGLIYLGNMGAYPDSLNSLATVNSPVLAGFWDHLKVSPTGRVSYFLDISGGPGHFKLFIDFVDMQWFYNKANNLVNFEITLDQQSGIIEFQYASIGNNPGSSAGASIGIANKTAGVNHFLSVTPASYPALSTFSNWNADDHITSFLFPPGTGILYEFVPYYLAGCCEGPHQISVSNVTSNSAVVSWIPPLIPSSFFDIYYSLSPIDLNEITPLHQVTACVGYGNPVMYDSVAGTITSYALNGLLPDTTYYIWVRSSCAVNAYMCSYSNWMTTNSTGGSSFQTSAAIPSIRRITAVSGSYAPWGSNQFLVVDSIGNAAVYNVNIETGATDSSSISLSQFKMQSIMDTLSAVGFYSLNDLYDGGFNDGSGVKLNIVTSTGQNEVEVINYCNNAINRIMKTINAVIFSSGIQLRYGEIDEICP